MKARYASLSLTLFIVGCSACAEHRHTKTAHVLDDRQKIASVKEAPPSVPVAGEYLQFRVSDFVNKMIRDGTGTEVARLDDLTVGANGRIISATLIFKNGAKVTIPFEKLKVTEGLNGALVLKIDIKIDIMLDPEVGGAATGLIGETQSKPPPLAQKPADETSKEPANKPQ
jgi:sporulation protein YlmC with PRC-barrel domain